MILLTSVPSDHCCWGLVRLVTGRQALPVVLKIAYVNDGTLVPSSGIECASSVAGVNPLTSGLFVVGQQADEVVFMPLTMRVASFLLLVTGIWSLAARAEAIGRLLPRGCCLEWVSGAADTRQIVLEYALKVRLCCSKVKNIRSRHSSR